MEDAAEATLYIRRNGYSLARLIGKAHTLRLMLTANDFAAGLPALPPIP